MDGFKQVYNAEDARSASVKCAKAIAVYSAAAVIYVALCAMFVLLYTLAQVHVLICFFADFLLTVLFSWISVLFFTVRFRRLRAEKRFFRIFENSNTVYFRGAYCGEDGECIQDGIKCRRYVFLPGDGQKKIFLIKNTAEISLFSDIIYDIKIAGDYIEAYKEADSDKN